MTRPSRHGTRLGFSMAEMCVFAAVAFLLLASLWMVYRGIARAGRSAESTAQAVALAQIAMERIRNDLLSAGAGDVSVDDEGALAISRDGEVVVEYRAAAEGGIVRIGAGKADRTPEGTEAIFARVPGKPQAVLIAVTGTSQGRTVTLRCEHAGETGARRLQHREWNPLAASHD